MAFLKFWRRWCAQIGKRSVRRIRKQRAFRPSCVAEVLEDRTLLSTITVTSLADNLTADGQVTLREALSAANSNESVDGSTVGESGVQDEIVFQDGLTGTVFLDGALPALQITDSVKIVGPGASNTIVDAQQQFRVFDITDTAGDVTLEGLAVTGGKTTADFDKGGGIRSVSSGTLTLLNSSVSGNSTDGSYAYGGGIYVSGGDLTLTGSTVTGNATFGHLAIGGGIYIKGTDVDHPNSVVLTYSTISGNSTYGDDAGGGGMSSALANVTISYSALSGNSTAGEHSYGGGLYSFVGSVTVSHSSVTGNSTEGDHAKGGAVWSRGAFTVIDSVISGNSTTGRFSHGGGLYVLDNDLTLTDSTFTGNATYGYASKGGAVYSKGFDGDHKVEVILTSSVVSGNSTGGNYSYGGGLASRYGNVTLTSSSISDNSTEGAYSYGGGLYSFIGSVTLNASSITGNSTTGAGSKGGGIWSRSELTLTDSTLSGNSTSGDYATGGGIYALDGNVTLVTSTLSGNSTAGFEAIGGGIRLMGFYYPPTDRPAVTLINSTLSGNATAGDSAYGGGIAAQYTSVVLYSSTLADNSTAGLLAYGGGIVAFDGNVAITNSIVAANSATASTSADILFGGGGSFTFLADSSLIGSNEGTPLAAAPVGSPDGDGNLVGTPAAPLDPLLAPLADYGGTTQTMALLAGSPAIDAGGATLLTTDQRGGPFARVAGGSQDIGAYELQSLNLVVTTFLDKLDPVYDPGNLSLREALALANANPGFDTITLAPLHTTATVSGPHASFVPGSTIDVTDGPLTISDTVEILGLGADSTTIDAFGLSRVFDVTPGAGDVTFEDVTITGGHTFEDDQPGAGIRFLSSGTLTVNRSAILSNTTTGQFGRGAGIYNDTGTVVVRESLISGNSTNNLGGDGAGIFSLNGPVTLINSTVSENSTAGYHSDAAAIYTDGVNGDVTLINSTITANTTAGDDATGAAVTVTRGDLTILNSIVAGNTIAAGTTPDVKFINASSVGTFLARHSLIGAVNGTPLAPASVGSPDANGNISGDFNNPLDARLAPLADNGGPTETHAPLPGSPVIDAGSNTLAVDPVRLTALTTDQRGIARINGGTVDMGAVEVLRLIVTTADDELDFVFDADDLSLREALEIANNQSGLDSIEFAPSLAGQTIFLTLGQLTISDTVQISGLGATDTIIDAQQDSRVFDVTLDGGDVLFENLTITGGLTTDENEGGAGIRFLSIGTLTVVNSTVSGNATEGRFSVGAGIFAYSGAVALADATVSGNSTTGNYSHGGGIFSNIGVVTLTRSVLSGNSTGGYFAVGGAVASVSGDLIVNASTLSGNYTAGVYSSGGAIGTQYSSVTLTASTVSDNATAEYLARGGGIYTSSGDIAIANSTLSGNRTFGDYADGGGIYAAFGDVTLVNSTIAGNSTYGYVGSGGGAFLYAGSLTAVNSIVATNQASDFADDVYFNDYYGNAGFLASNSLFGNNDGTPLDAAPVGLPDASGNIVGTASDPIDPLLGPLDDNGGPTETMALLPGSPALNAGSNNLAVDPLTNLPLDFDQRGASFVRIFDDTVDMGAFELGEAIGLVTLSVQPDSLTYGTAGTVSFDVTVYRATGYLGAFVADLSLINSSLPAGTHFVFDTDSLSFGAYDDVLSATLSIETEFGGAHTPAGTFGFAVSAQLTGKPTDFATADGQLTVDKATPVIVVSPYSVFYDGAAHTSTGSATGVFGESLAGLDLSGTTHTAAGNYTDAWTFTDSTGNYLNASGTVGNTIAVPPLATTFTRPRYVPTPLTFAELQAAANVAIPSGHTLGFKIDTLSSGTLSITHLGTTTPAPVGTIVVDGDTLTWTSVAAATGLTDAFKLLAVDLSDNSNGLALVQFRVDLVNVAPSLSVVSTFDGGLQQTPYNITFEALQAAANEVDPNGDALAFRIRTVPNGTLTITKSGSNTPVPIVQAQTLVQPGDVLTWTGGVGQSGNAFPAFAVRAWDGFAGSGVDIQVTINLAAFGSQFSLSGPWIVGGKLANINQAGSNLTYTDQNGVVTTGSYSQLATIIGRGGLTGVVDTSTPDNGRIVWSDGAIWLKLSVGGQYYVTNPNQPNDPPAMVRVVQNGGALTLYNKVGDSADAAFYTGSLIRIPKWKLTASYADGALAVSNGLTWHKLDLSPSYTESVSSLPTAVKQVTNLTSNTIELLFTDTVGGTSKGVWQTPTQVAATDWNSIGTVIDGQILWTGGLKDGEIWNKHLVFIGAGNGAGPGFVKIEATNNQLRLTNKLGTVMHARILDPFTLYNIDTAKTITRKNGKLDFGAGLIWSDFDFNALDAVFSDINTFPFVS